MPISLLSEYILKRHSHPVPGLVFVIGQFVLNLVHSEDRRLKEKGSRRGDFGLWNVQDRQIDPRDSFFELESRYASVFGREAREHVSKSRWRYGPMTKEVKQS